MVGSLAGIGITGSRQATAVEDALATTTTRASGLPSAPQTDITAAPIPANASGATEDRLYYGDQDYPGTIRTQNVSGQVGCAAAGFNEVAAWVLSAPGDSFGSVTSVEGDVGAPGRYPEGLCELFADGFE